MIKVKALENFDLKDYSKLKNIKRVGREKEGRLFEGDLFECDEKTADYLLGNNPLKRPVVEVIELPKEEEIEQVENNNEDTKSKVVAKKPKKSKKK